MSFLKKYGFLFVGVALVAGAVGYGANGFTVGSAESVNRTRPTYKAEKPVTNPGVVNVTFEGIITIPNIGSVVGDKKASSDGFNQNVTATLKYIKVDASKAICMCDVVEYGSVMKTINGLKKILETNNEAYLLIDSPGGSVFDGAMLVSFIEGSKKPIYTVAVGMAASMGAQILSVGHKRFATANAIIMFHPAAGGLRGTVPEMESLLNFIKRYTEAWDKKTAARAGIPYAKFEIMVLKNLWLMADEAKALNLIDEVVYID